MIEAIIKQRISRHLPVEGLKLGAMFDTRIGSYMGYVQPNEPVNNGRCWWCFNRRAEFVMFGRTFCSPDHASSFYGDSDMTREQAREFEQQVEELEEEIERLQVEFRKLESEYDDADYALVEARRELQRLREGKYEDRLRQSG